MLSGLIYLFGHGLDTLRQNAIFQDSVEPNVAKALVCLFFFCMDMYAHVDIDMAVITSAWDTNITLSLSPSLPSIIIHQLPSQYQNNNNKTTTEEPLIS